jgi:hypothetical protein
VGPASFDLPSVLCVSSAPHGLCGVPGGRWMWGWAGRGAVVAPQRSSGLLRASAVLHNHRSATRRRRIRSRMYARRLAGPRYRYVVLATSPPRMVLAIGSAALLATSTGTAGRSTEPDQRQVSAAALTVHRPRLFSIVWRCTVIRCGAGGCRSRTHDACMTRAWRVKSVNYRSPSLPGPLASPA